MSTDPRPPTLGVGKRTFEAVQRLPDRLVPPLVNRHPSPVSVHRRGGRWWVHDDADELAVALTGPKDAPRFLIGDRTIGGRLRTVRNRYEHPDVGVTVDAGDRAVDVDAFLGEFTLGALRDRAAGDVLAIEPDPRSYGALTATLAATDADATARQQAAWHTDGATLPIHLGTEPSETTAFTPDSGGVAGAVDAETVALESLGPIDFLKVEAEGAEPEVLAGLAKGQAAKVAVNCDPERNGAAPTDAVIAELERLTYDTIETDGRTVFARYGQPD